MVLLLTLLLTCFQNIQEICLLNKNVQSHIVPYCSFLQQHGE